MRTMTHFVAVIAALMTAAAAQAQEVKVTEPLTFYACDDDRQPKGPAGKNALVIPQVWATLICTKAVINYLAGNNSVLSLPLELSYRGPGGNAGSFIVQLVNGNNIVILNLLDMVWPNFTWHEGRYTVTLSSRGKVLATGYFTVRDTSQDEKAAFKQQYQVQAWVDLSILEADPFSPQYNGKIVATWLVFDRMISPTEAAFSRNNSSATLSKVPAGIFKPRDGIMAAVKVRGLRPDGSLDGELVGYSFCSVSSCTGY